MFKPSFMELNRSPERLNTSQPTGAASQLAALLQNPANADNVTISEMVGNPLYDKTDKIDKIGIAQKKIADSAKIVKSKEKLIRGLNARAEQIRKPSQK